MPRHSRRCLCYSLSLSHSLSVSFQQDLPLPFTMVSPSSFRTSRRHKLVPLVQSARASGRRATRALRSRPGTETAIVKLASTHNAGVAASGVAHPRPPSSNFGVWFVPRQARIDSVIRPVARGRLPTFVEIHANSRAHDAWHRDVFSHAPLAQTPLPRKRRDLSL